MMDAAELDRFFPAHGPCLLCGTPGLGARHRVIDAIAERVAAGETPDEVAADYNLPERAAVVAVEWAEHMDGRG